MKIRPIIVKKNITEEKEAEKVNEALVVCDPIIPKINVSITPKAAITPKIQEFSPIDQSVHPDNLILSFDVGIINLAYCILSNVDNQLKIYDWNIINLANGNQKLLCQTLTNSGKKCDKKAFYTSDDKKAYCLIHSKKIKETLTRNVTVANVTELELKSLLFKALDSNKIFLKPNVVLVENQPLKGREKIRGVGHAIFDYFVLRGQIDNGKIYKDMKFIDAKNKLTLYDGPPLSCHLKTQYARNKWYAENYCKYIIRDLSYESNFFQTYKQKTDDLADCFLQGLWYIKYGQNGSVERPPITSTHQKLVYKDNNILSYKKVRAYAPSKKIIASGKYTISNIKYLLNRKTPIDGDLKSSIEYYFSTVSALMEIL